MLRILLLFMAVQWGVISNAQSNMYLQQLDEKYASGMFRSDNAYTIVAMNDPASVSYFNVFQYLQGRVPGLYIYQNSFINAPFLSYRYGQPVLFLDEMRVDAQTLSSINMNDIAIIKVFPPPFMGTFGGANGAIAVYTKDGDEEA